MKNLTRSLLLALLGTLTSLSFAAPPPMDVSVADAQGKIVHKGTTDAKGGFATGKLPAGEYTVLLRSKGNALKSGQYALQAAAGKKRVTANTVPAKEFLGGGVALKLKVADGLNIIGAVSDVNVAGGTGDAKVKVVNGVRYVWVSSAGLGSNLGGRWVEEGALDTFNRNTLKPDAFRTFRDGHADNPMPRGN